MNQQDWETFVAELDNVQRQEAYGYHFFFVGDDHMLAFTTIGYSDNEFDNVSKLDREGVFRINIGISRASYDALFADGDGENIDYAMLDVFMPHPHYAKQHFISILNPTGANVEATKKLIREAHQFAAARFERKTNR